ncbi:sigma-54 dependent transcriptional regulator [Temperatibacter marinus]|uniref:Sigma-54 dependent transcriptional regulator n=1 Tax=Temperatibacter marinus TaxID=1456591 RepID=A0AA52H816_9PROT|nr:sigma-54 dependent transcriptional regulator [Temperatibacter marinus]WND01656.1 sigma-54 dependent transcriptional regulator [Temperatibacter marinus]
MTKKDGKILIVDDDEDILTAGKLLLRRHFKQVMTCNKPEFIPELLSSHQFDAILLDMNFGPGESTGEQGFIWLGKILEIDPSAVIVMITAHGGVNIAVEAMKLGATDFIAKPWQNEKVVATLSACVKLGKTRVEAKSLKQKNEALIAASLPSQHNMIISSSGPMNDVLTLISRTAPTEANVFILGENGTGKELAARAIHTASLRRNNVFMSVDLGSLSESLFESELFGHKKGAFTGAREDRTGRFQAASGGTLFLDEIGNLPKHLQAKLLTVLEQRTITPLGSNDVIPIDVRIITATNIPKTSIMNEDHFRQDLLFRLNTVEINLPPLRERREDILAIAEHYIAHYSKKYQKAIKPLSQAAIEAMTNYDWPGNVRALRHAIERAIILAEGESFQPQDFSMDTSGEGETKTAQPKSTPLVDDDLNLERIEKKAIEVALRKNQYNISHTAKELGLTRAALYRRMEKHGL